MLVHVPAVGLYISELGESRTSAVSTVPSGSSVQPSSALKSALLASLTLVHCSDFGSSTASRLVSFCPSSIRPSGNIVEGESPTHCHPAGCPSAVQALVCGSKIAPRFVSCSG